MPDRFSAIAAYSVPKFSVVAAGGSVRWVSQNSARAGARPAAKRQWQQDSPFKLTMPRQTSVPAASQRAPSWTSRSGRGPKRCASLPT